MIQHLSDIVINQMTIELLIRLFASIVIGSVICITYAFSHSRAIYSKNFNAALMMITILSAMSMLIVFRNSTVIISIIGSLSLIRYRNSIKDNRDLVFIFWAVAAGILSGVSEYIIVAIGSFCIFTVMFILGAMKNHERILMVVRGEGGIENTVMEIIHKVFNGNAKLKVNNSTDNVTELIFQMPKLEVKDRKSTFKKIKEELYNVDEVKTINFVSQTEELGV